MKKKINSLDFAAKSDFHSNLSIREGEMTRKTSSPRFRQGLFILKTVDLDFLTI